MKIAIIGDVHLGASYNLGKKDHKVNINSRLVDYDITLLDTIKTVSEAGCKHLIFTGDIFEHRSPSIKQQERFSNALRVALELGIEEIHIVVGNHDQQRLSKATTLSYLKELNLDMIHVYDEIDHVTIYDDDKPAANLLFIPFRDRKWYGVETSHEAIGKIREELTYNMGAIENSAKKILIGHMVIEDTMWMLDEYAELYESNELLLPKDMFRNIDMTIMGHVHTPGVISKSPFIYYVGSMEKRGAFENHDKKYVIIDLETGSFKPCNEPCRELYDIRIDFSGNPHGEVLMDDVTAEIDLFCRGKDMKSSIVRTFVSLMAEDAKNFSIKRTMAYLYEKYEVEHCVEIKPSLLFNRQSRDSTITEHGNDSESYMSYINREYRDSKILDGILELGLELIEDESTEQE